MATQGSSQSDSAAARAALDDVGSARGRVADRMSTPWWYRVGWGLTLGLVLVGLAVGGTEVVVATCVGGVAVLSGLVTRLARTTGVSLDRYAAGRPAVLYLLGVLVLFVAGLVVRSVVGPWWVAVPFAAALVIWTLLMEPRIDAAVRTRLRGRGTR